MDADLQPVLRAAAKAKIIAVGESTHGTGDFFAIKDRIFRYLAEHDGVGVLAMEANWADGVAIDEYLQTGKGNLGNILSRTWDYREVLELLEWMRRYNEQHPHALHFFGMDMQQPNTAIPYILGFYNRFDANKLAAITQDLACINKPTSTLFLRGLSDANACIESIRAVVQQLLEAGRDGTAGNRSAYLTALHAAKLTEEAATEYSKSKPEEKAAARDLAMAHNVEWLHDTLEPSSKILVWAHNDHIAVGMEQWPSMGTILRKAYEKDYFAIGQTFDHGMVAQAQVAAVDIPAAAPGTSEATFREVGVPIFFLNLHTVPQGSALGRWLAQPQLIRSLGSALITSADAQNEMTTVLSRAFDALIFVDRARAARWVLVQVQYDLRCCAGYMGLPPLTRWSFHSVSTASANGGTISIGDASEALYLTAQPQHGEDLLSYIEGRSSVDAYQERKISVSGMLAVSRIQDKALVALEILGDDQVHQLVYRDSGGSMPMSANSWTPFSLTADVPRQAKTLVVVVMLHGSGTVWVSHLAVREGQPDTGSAAPQPMLPHRFAARDNAAAHRPRHR
jgi:erythromycin esterase